MTKRELGQYFTENAKSVFSLTPFLDWAKKHNIKSKTLLEPYAGDKHIIKALTELGLIDKYVAYDIDETLTDVLYQDNLIHFPTGFELVITNPPYLAKNSASKRKITQYDKLFEQYEDLYEVALANTLENTTYSALIIPESFITSSTNFAKTAKQYCEVVISITLKGIFAETNHPVCLALFNKNKPETQDTAVYRNNEYLGDLYTLNGIRARLLRENPNTYIGRIVFNDPNGLLNISCVDNSINATNIYFTLDELIEPEKIKVSSRAITRVSLYDQNDELIQADRLKDVVEKANLKLKDLRTQTHDVFFTSFKGLRKDGKYRRRLDFGNIRAILNSI